MLCRFVDYLTKWPKVYAVPDHTAITIAKLLVEQVICRHELPNELLSYHGADFLAEWVSEICQLTGMKKYTSAFHPQSDRVVKRIHRMPTDMILSTYRFTDTNGTVICRIYYLHTDSSLIAQLGSHLFCCMAETRDCQQRPCWRVNLNLVDWRSMTIKPTYYWGSQLLERTPS